MRIDGFVLTAVLLSPWLRRLLVGSVPLVKLHFDVGQILIIASKLVRRSFLGRASLGLGSMALAVCSRGVLAGAAGRSTISGYRVSTPFCANEGQAGDFPLHGGRPVATGAIRREAHASPDERRAGARVVHEGSADRPASKPKGACLCLATSRRSIASHGQSGQTISNYLPHIGSIADDICIVRSMQTEQINHDPAHTFMNTGTAHLRPAQHGLVGQLRSGQRVRRPAGLCGADQPAGNRAPQPISARQWHSGFLPGKFQGVPFHSTGDPVHYVGNPPGVDRYAAARVIKTVNDLNRMRDAVVHNPDIATRIAQYELAFRMQMSVPDLVNIAEEPKHVLDMYGVKRGGRVIRV